MIEISHKQAQHLIREGQDRRLPDEQWATLQAHLERCPDCRAYQQRLASYDRDLGRALRSRWSSARGPRTKVGERVVELRARRKQFRRIAGRASLWVLGIALLFGYLVYRDANAPEPVIIPTMTLGFGMAPRETSTPAPLPLNFRGLTAFESHRDGNGEIYLFKSGPQGPELTNLTLNSANDSQPSWSPDGEWIAFLSDRSGKDEVYVMHIAGSRLTKLTSDPNVFWEGPIEWSPDGGQLAVGGRRNGSGGALRLYTVSMDGAQPGGSIANTLDTNGWQRFSSAQRGLAFPDPNVPNGLALVDTQTGVTSQVTREDVAQLGLKVDTQEGAFDWSLGGRSLVYITDGPTPKDQPAGAPGEAASQIRLSPEMDTYSPESITGSGAETIDSVPLPTRFRAVSWMPHSLIVASLVGSDDCWTVRLSNAYNHDQLPRDLTGLCVIGGLDHTSWSPDGRWLVLLARPADGKTPAIYALRMPDTSKREDSSQLTAPKAFFEKVMDIPAADLRFFSLGQQGEVQDFTAAANGAWRLMPRVRPAGRSISITPKAVAEAQPAPAPAHPPHDTPGKIVFTAQIGQNLEIHSIRPDGTQRLSITQKVTDSGPSVKRCPRLSPDGKRLAFLDTWLNGQNDSAEVIVMDAESTWQTSDPGRAVLVRFDFPHASVTSSTITYTFPYYGCPVWSPDGKQIVLPLNATQTQSYLVLLDAAGKAEPKFLPTGLISTLSAPVWLPKDPANPTAGADTVLLVSPRYGTPAYLARVNLSAAQGPMPLPAASAATTPPTTLERNALVTPILDLTSWDDVQNLALSPDGKRLAMVMVYLNSVYDTGRLGRAIAQLRVLDLANLSSVTAVTLPHYDPFTTGMGAMAWLANDQIGLVRDTALIGPAKTTFNRVILGQDGLETLATFEDLTYQAAWANDGRWVVFTAESGLWVLDLQAAQAGQASPALLTGDLSHEHVTEVEWK